VTIQALELFRSVPRYLAARAVGERVPGLVSGPLAPIRLVSKKDPEPPGPGWARVRSRDVHPIDDPHNHRDHTSVRDIKRLARAIPFAVN